MKYKQSKTCITCGTEYHPWHGNNFEASKFCSVPCGAEWRGKRGGANAAMRAKQRRDKEIKQPRTHRLIPLTKGMVAKVDITDYDLADINWAYTDKGYARRTVLAAPKVKKNERLHRVIMERVIGRPLEKGEQVDHVNGDRLDNRRSNLRVASHRQNSFNVRRKNSLGYHGVCKNKKRFGAIVGIEGLDIYVGTFDTPIEAAWYRDQWAMTLHEDFAVLNFDYHEVPRQDGQQSFDIATYVQKSTQSSGVPLRVKNPQAIAALARKLSQR